MDDAKRKELKSFCANEAFDVVRKEDCRHVKPQTGRWVLAWKELPGGAWGIKARLVIKGLMDQQGQTPQVKSPTAGRASQRIVMTS